MIREHGVEGWPTFQDFLARRMAPAMRTCAMLEERQAKLSEKLSRAANLLRTRVDVEIERQNRDLLSAMNDRARMQLRLQETVEGLSVAAISYYVVGLAAYVFKGAKDAGLAALRRRAGDGRRGAALHPGRRARRAAHPQPQGLTPSRTESGAARRPPGLSDAAQLFLPLASNCLR